MWLDLLMFIRKNKEIGGFGKVYLSHLTSDVAKQNVNNSKFTIIVYNINNRRNLYERK